MMNVEESAIVPTKRARRITPDIITEMARLMATRKVDERGACLMLEIKPESWAVWKCRQGNRLRFDNLFLRLRETKIDGLIHRIESASLDAEMMHGDKLITRRGDWRAAAWIAEKIAPERFAQQTNIQQSNREIPTLSIEAMKRVYASEASSPPSPFLLPAAPARPSERSEPESIDQSSIDNRGEADDQSAAQSSGTGFNSGDDDGVVRIPPRRVKIPVRRNGG